MEVSLKGKKVLVTGAGRGIGKDLVETLVKQGATVYALTKTEEMLEKLKSEFPSIIPILVDLRDWDASEKALEQLPAMDCLVNNAGVADMQPITEVTKDSFDLIFDINVRALVNVTRIISKKMIEAKVHGSIVNVSSVSAQKSVKNLSVYCTSKAAVDMITRCSALELGEHKIRVNAVNPTVVWTQMGKDLWTDPVKSTPILNRIPLGRFAEMEEVTNVILFLLSNKTSMTTGETFLIDGGYSVS